VECEGGNGDGGIIPPETAVGAAPAVEAVANRAATDRRA
jgi:hypothetical protein